MRVNCTSSQVSSPQNKPPSPLDKGSRKKIYTFLGIVAVVAVASTLIFVLLTVPDFGATIPLEYNYAVGESLTYNDTIAENSWPPETYRVSMTVLSFDGENYTLNESTPLGCFHTANVNRSGACLPNVWQQADCRPFGSFFPKDKARVGETWQVPMSLGDYTYFAFNGTIAYKFGDIQNITVPAGTYKVFKVDVSGSNLNMVVKFSSGDRMYYNITVASLMYMEYGTCRLIESETQTTTSIAVNTQDNPGIYNSSAKKILIEQTKY